MTTASNTPIISGYEVNELLYVGSRTLVYRGIREEDSLPVVIKFLRCEYPTFNELLQFRNQYAIAKNAEERYQSALGLKQDLEKCLY
jgi:serine/threonine protein kinase